MPDVESFVMKHYDIRFVSNGPKFPALAKVIGQPYLILNRQSKHFELALTRLYLEHIYQEY